MPRNKINQESFGYRHMRESGWNEGEGLGIDNNGETDPIKVNLKHDTAGLGHDRGKEFTDQWWDHVFNKAAAKVSVECDGEGVKVTSNSQLSDKQKKKLKKKVLYGNFVKGSTLEQGQETPECSESIPEQVEAPSAAISILTDDQLLAACGGRTAHKGARHGFKMNGKLFRVEQQDSQGCAGEHPTPRKKNKKSKKERRDLDLTEESTLLADSQDEDCTNRKKRRKKEASPQNNIDTLSAQSNKCKRNQLESLENTDHTDGTVEAVKKKKKRKKNKHD